MRFKMFVIFAAVILTVAACTIISAKTGSKIPSDKTDQISGEWTGTFEVQGNTVAVTFNFKLGGSKVTGKIESAHTGAGIVDKGNWAHDKLTFTAVFDSHDSIEIAGTIKDGKLSGEFHTEGMVGKWEATKK